MTGTALRSGIVDAFEVAALADGGTLPVEPARASAGS